MARVKICGLNSQEAVAAAAAADWVGFNFFARSPRFVTPAAAGSLRGGRNRVGLFVDPRDDEVEAALDPAALDTVQVYADAARAAAIRSRFGRPVWRAVGVAAAADLPRAPEPIDGVGIEAKPPGGADRPGGNAARFDWSILRGWAPPLPWILAGGLRPDNVREAIAATGADAVDVASGVESRPGVKDPALIAAFIAAATG